LPSITVKKWPALEPFAEANGDLAPARMGVFERLAKKSRECSRTIEHNKVYPFALAGGKDHCEHSGGDNDHSGDDTKQAGDQNGKK
jgi:hypothetical protein